MPRRPRVLGCSCQGGIRRRYPQCEAVSWVKRCDIPKTGLFVMDNGVPRDAQPAVYMRKPEQKDNVLGHLALSEQFEGTC
jgi:hypothetical protein